MKDKIIQIEIDNGGDILGLSETGNVYQLNLTNIDAPLWEFVTDSPEKPKESTDIHISGVDAAKEKLEEIKNQA